MIFVAAAGIVVVAATVSSIAAVNLVKELMSKHPVQTPEAPTEAEVPTGSSSACGGVCPQPPAPPVLLEDPHTAAVLALYH